jgi:2-iminobutanoate/2-iminopropanoate deaminase
MRRLDVEGITTPITPYPNEVAVGSLIFVSGQVSFDDLGAVVARGDVTGQTRQCLRRLERVLDAAGAGLDDVVSATVYLSDAAHAAELSAEWGRWFAERRPARATVVAALLDPDLLVEVQAVAHMTLSASRQETSSQSSVRSHRPQE